MHPPALLILQQRDVFCLAVGGNIFACGKSENVDAAMNDDAWHESVEVMCVPEKQRAPETALPPLYAGREATRSRIFPGEACWRCGLLRLLEFVKAKVKVKVKVKVKAKSKTSRREHGTPTNFAYDLTRM